LLNGSYAPLAPVIVNLTVHKTDPSNTTFYVYVTIVNATASYQIRLTRIPETSMFMFVGTIVTGTTKVTSINITKFTKFGGYRVSSSPQGQSIPATTGLPSREVHLS